MSSIIKFSNLEKSAIGFEFEGYKFKNSEITFILVDAAPGEGVKLHSHPYTEIFIVQEGAGFFTLGDKVTEVSGNEILIVPPNTPHKFINTGNCNLRQVDIHQSPKFITNWLED